MVSIRTDPWALASLRAVESALDWYVAEVEHAQNPPISAENAAALRAVIRQESPLRAGQLEGLVHFAQTMVLVGRRAPDVPSCNLGDALTALSIVYTTADEGRRWHWDPAVDADAFAKLRFSEASAGIARTQRANRAGWQAHAQHNCGFILDAARECEKRELAVVLGAGQAFDLPLLELARTFERLILVDIDAAALEQTLSHTFKDPGLHAKVEPRVLDLCGINGQLVGAVDRVLAGAGSAPVIAAELAQICRSYGLHERPALLGAHERADLLVSGLVLSQIAWPQRVYALAVYEKRFGKLHGEEAERSWVVPWWELELRIQQDHVSCLGSSAEHIVLSSDVISRPTLLDSLGVERETGRKIFALGVSSLSERIPQALQVEQHAAWQWARYRASRQGTPGSLMDVEGLRLRPRFR